MDKKIADKWVKALRSGKYKQGQQFLRDADNTFCCLGVLCDVLDPNGWSQESDGVNFEYLGEAGALPIEILLKCDMRTANGQLYDPYSLGSISLACLNDNGFRDGLTRSGDTGPLAFDEIADVIQMAWEDL